MSSLRFNVEVVTAETGEETTENYVITGKVIALVHRMRAGDAIVVNAVEGPDPGEL